MSEKLATLGIERAPDFLYFVRRGAIWRVARPSSESLAAADRPEIVTETETGADANFIYFLDSDGDLARVRRSASPPRRHKKRSSRPAAGLRS